MSRLRTGTKKTLIGIAGALVVLIGLVLVPYPGPGWLIVFAGLAILATEFEFAQRWLAKARGYYDHWQQWMKQQNMGVQAIMLALTGLVIIVTVWLVNGFGIINGLFTLDQTWLVSPLFR
jgi:uncharacterized protein (TIGR02611 family)